MKPNFAIFDPVYDVDMWNDFVRRSIDATFLHERSYMDYHAGRFKDFSILIRDKAKLMGLIPAHREGHDLFSHKGLTYGGWLRKEEKDLEQLIRIWRALLFFLQSQGIENFYLKEIPLFYARFLSETTRAVFQFFGKPVHAAPFWAIDTRKSLEKLLNRNRKRSINKAATIKVKQSEEWATFWEILQENLLFRHQARPVHSLDEILLLKSRFPDRIKLFGAYENDKMIAGAVVYLLKNVLHFQYLSALPAGINRSAADKLVWEIIRQNYGSYSFVGMGTAEKEGQPDYSLAYWKYSFGGEPFLQYLWHFDVKHFGG